MTGFLPELLTSDKDDLVNLLYNRKIADFADYEQGEPDPHGHGKRIPYIGWFWRDADFVRKHVYIGNCGSFVGVMENNKWDYPERAMTEPEVDTFIGYLERTFTAALQGGVLADTKAAAETVLCELWQWFQTLRVEENRDEY